MPKDKKAEYDWCEHYGGPKDGYWCSTGDLSTAHFSGVLSYRDTDGITHFYVLIRQGLLEKDKHKKPYRYYAYGGTSREKCWDNAIVGHPGCNKNNYDPDLEPEWYNWDKD
jgi:hypothetical protein